MFWINDTSARISLNHRSRAGEGKCSHGYWIAYILFVLQHTKL